MKSEPPIWLSDEAELLALLGKALDRFDHQSGETRQRAIVLSLEQELPSLARGDASADQSWALLGELQQRGVLSIRKGKRSAYDPEWSGARVAFAPESEEALRAWLGRAPAQRAMEIWRNAVHARAGAFVHGVEILAERRIAIRERTADEVVAALADIGRVTGPITLRQLSAHVFWGDSKVLDDRHELIAALFPALEIRDRAIVVAVFLPRVCNGVLFIENQDTYTAATQSFPKAATNLALVYASGFRSAAERIRRRSGALLHYAGPGTVTLQSAFERWWFEDIGMPGPCHFWGDLDFAGMQILKSLRARFSAVQAWRPGYAPLLKALIHSGGHRVTPGETGQFDPVVTGCPFADEELLPAIRQWGLMDQERPFAGESNAHVA
jgi:hypothetical protein